ncbi:MAG: DUF2971 domain-containing protein [Rhodanobacteraceae bacterium]|nr:DUF2971 domain-containing protein [Rhodanobacteraceae bacterium]MBP9153769.1 DUF2971 domain-containing protein [Xanthomonadales bacterium]HQW81055.1 DUF2971 domain-containing protein [Pseudomonadota bacterium]
MLTASQLPKSVRFKYRRANVDRDVSIIRDNLLWFDTRDRLNDITEMDPDVVFSDGSGFDAADVEKYVQERFADDQPAAERARMRLSAEIVGVTYPEEYKLAVVDVVRELLETTVICSFSRTPCIHPMWGLYGDDHTGYALGFDFDVPWPAHVGTHLGPQVMNLNLLPIEYSDRYPVIDGDKVSRSDPDSELARAVLTKHSDWTFEQEERVVIMMSERGSRPFQKEMLRYIVFGSRISPENQDRITELALARTCPPVLLKAYRSIGSYEMLLAEL